MFLLIHYCRFLYYNMHSMSYGLFPFYYKLPLILRLNVFMQLLLCIYNGLCVNIIFFILGYGLEYSSCIKECWLKYFKFS
jgi:hypothetical protein